MSYKDKASDYRGGRVNPEDAADRPERLRYPCFAEGCPMPGTMFPDQVLGEKRHGVCPWHYRLAPSDIPKVTKVLQDWNCVTGEIEAARAALRGPHAADPKALDEVHAAAWSRLEPLLAHTGWSDVLKPRPGEHLDDWARHLERFIGKRVVEVLSINQRRAA